MMMGDGRERAEGDGSSCFYNFFSFMMTSLCCDMLACEDRSVVARATSQYITTSYCNHWRAGNYNNSQVVQHGRTSRYSLYGTCTYQVPGTRYLFCCTSTFNNIDIVVSHSTHLHPYIPSVCSNVLLVHKYRIMSIDDVSHPPRQFLEDVFSILMSNILLKYGISGVFILLWF